jgi:RNA polymerase sigma factor (sigma-70 family)
MTQGTLGHVLKHLRHLAEVQGAGDLTDGDLLERFCAAREEAAFALLVQRHGPMVLAVCRRVLRDAEEAEDAFQATFLVLVRKAASIRKRGSVASWLHGVARRVALRAREQTAARRARERRSGEMARIEAIDEATWDELRAVLDEEIGQLPEKYRAPVALCYLEGKTYEQAGRELGWPKSSLAGRLDRARRLLRQRLIRRGISLSAGALVAALAGGAAAATVPALLVLGTVRAAALGLTGKAVAAGAVSARAAALAEGVAKTMGPAWLKPLLALAALVALAGTGLLAFQGPAATAPRGQADAPRATPEAGEPGQRAEPGRTDRFGDPLPPGARARLGTVRLRHGGEVGQFAFAPGGKALATAGNNGVVSLWDVTTGRELRCLKDATVGIEPGVAFAPDGKVLATGQYAEVCRWDTASWSELPRFPLKSSTVGQLLFSPDGGVLACLGKYPQDNRNTVAFLDASTGGELHRMDGLKNYVAPCVAFAPDGKTWAYADRRDKAIGLHDALTGQELRRLEGHSSRVVTVAFSPDGRTLASTDDEGTLRFWNTATGRPLAGRGHFEAQDNLAYSADGKRLVGGGAGRGPLVYDIAAGKQVAAPESRPGTRGVMLLSPDGKLLASAEQQSLRLWDAGTLEPVRRAEAHEDEVRAVAFAPGGGVVVSAAGEDGFVRRWEVATGQVLPPLRDFRDHVYALTYSPDGRTLAVGTGNHQGTVWLLDAATGKRLRTFVVPGDHVLSLAFAADGRTLLSGQGRDTRLWDVATGTVLQTLPGGAYNGHVFALAPDGRVAAGGDERGVIHLWQTATGTELRALRFGAAVHAVAFSPDGKALASGGYGKTIKLWDVATGAPLWQAEGHEGWVRFLAFSADGKTLASGGADGDVRLWEVATGKERWRFAGHRHPVRSGTFSGDGRLLATGSADTTVLVWDLAAPAGPVPNAPRSARDLDALWADLAAEDARRAYQAIGALAGADAQGVSLLKDRLAVVRPAEDGRIGRLVADLDSDSFEAREQATRQLEAFGGAAEAALRKALAGRPPAEARRRIEELLGKLDPRRSSEGLRVLRALEVLERIGSRDARQLVAALAAGAPEARLTQEAKASLSRWPGDPLVTSPRR